MIKLCSSFCIVVATFFSFLVIFFGLVLSLKIQTELSGNHRLQKVSYLKIVLLPSNQLHVTNRLSLDPYTHPKLYRVYIYIQYKKSWPRFTPTCKPWETHYVRMKLDRLYLILMNGQSCFDLIINLGLQWTKTKLWCARHLGLEQ